MGPCAKRRVRCVIVSACGERFVGENWCENPQPVCPRAPGEGYEKCQSVCRQMGHAEVVALIRAGHKAQGAVAYLEGHDEPCWCCAGALRTAGVRSLTVIKPHLAHDEGATI